MLLLVLLLAAGTPTVDEILQRYEASHGDVRLARTHESRFVRMHYEEPSGAEAEVFEYYLAPNKYAQTMILEDGGSFRFGTDGKMIWNAAPHGIESMPVETAPPIARDAVFNRSLKLRELYPDLRVVGPAKVAGRAAWLVEAVAPEGEKEQLYFDAGSGLLVRRTYAYILPGGHRLPRDFIIEEYADFGGVRMPSVIRQFQPSAGIFRVVHVEHNAEVFERIFDVPTCGGSR
jgi:hypothetical protein